MVGLINVIRTIMCLLLSIALFLFVLAMGHEVWHPTRRRSTYQLGTALALFLCIIHVLF